MLGPSPFSSPYSDVSIRCPGRRGRAWEPWSLVHRSAMVVPAWHAASCPRPPSVREKITKLMSRCRRRPRTWALPCTTTPFALHAYTFVGLFLSGGCSPDRVGDVGPDAAVVPEPCEVGPRSTIANSREGSVVAMHSPSALPQPRHKSPPLVE